MLVVVATGRQGWFVGGGGGLGLGVRHLDLHEVDEVAQVRQIRYLGPIEDRPSKKIDE